MIVNILNNKNLTLNRKIKNLIFYLSRKRGAKKSWKKRHSKVFKVNSHYKTPCDKKVEAEHKKMWSDFGNNVDLTTLRISKNITGISDPKMIPEDIYTADIEPTLISDKSVDYIGIKSFYNHWFKSGVFPEDILHRIDGKFYNEKLENISYEEFVKIIKKIKYPVIAKPIKDTYGGKDICFAKCERDIMDFSENRMDFIVQKKIEQHDYFNKFHPSSLNTVKVFLYRSVVDENLYVLSMALRMGKSGSLDNEASGGINSFIKEDGYLNGYAIDKFGTIYTEHPDTKFTFDCSLPDYDLLKSLALEIGSKVFYTRVMGLDACYDVEGKWRIIEVNTFAQSIRFSQYGGKPFFGEFTDEVIEYCKNNHWALLP